MRSDNCFAFFLGSFLINWVLAIQIFIIICLYVSIVCSPLSSSLLSFNSSPDLPSSTPNQGSWVGELNRTSAFVSIKIESICLNQGGSFGRVTSLPLLMGSVISMTLILIIWNCCRVLKAVTYKLLLFLCLWLFFSLTSMKSFFASCSLKHFIICS